jgi:hypothetical protein
MGSYSIEKIEKACWAKISESYPRRLDISSLHLFIAPKPNGFGVQINLVKQKLRSRTLNNSANDFFECVSPAFSPAELASTDPKQTHDQAKQNLWQITFVRTENEQSIHQTWPSRLFGCICLRLSEELYLLSSDLAHLCLTPSMFEDFTYFVGSPHTKNSNPTKFSRTRLETPASSLASAPLTLTQA